MCIVQKITSRLHVLFCMASYTPALLRVLQEIKHHSKTFLKGSVSKSIGFHHNVIRRNDCHRSIMS